MCRPVDGDVVLASFEHRVIWKMICHGGWLWPLYALPWLYHVVVGRGLTWMLMDVVGRWASRDGVMGRVVGAFFSGVANVLIPL
jgi:hypothetical protein